MKQSLSGVNRRRSPASTIPLPPDENLAKLCRLLLAQREQKIKESRYARVKEVLALLGQGAILGAAILAPKATTALAPSVRESPDWEQWKHYNVSYLRRTLRRLEQQKDVEVAEEKGQSVIKLTSGGKRKILRYNIEGMSVPRPKQWDRQWRLVLYDVPVAKHSLGEMVRQALRTIGFYPIQKSVYLFPYPCFEQIEFLREYYGLGNSLQYMLVKEIEHDDAYKTYFALS